MFTIGTLSDYETLRVIVFFISLVGAAVASKDRTRLIIFMWFFIAKDSLSYEALAIYVVFYLFGVLFSELKHDGEEI